MMTSVRWRNLYSFICFFLFFALIQSMRLPDPPVFDKVAHYPSVCYLPPDSGMCPSSNNINDDDDSAPTERLDVRYYFDITTGECFPFGVQNCGGNENRFKTMTDCQETCRMK